VATPAGKKAQAVGFSMREVCLPGLVYWRDIMDKPLVGIVMGSDSDLPVMKEAADVLREFGIPYEVVISSAHRAPEKTAGYARNAAGRGLEVIIAGAGGAAHLAGVIAALTPLPVVGVPVKSGALSGLDALYAVVQMPAGIPVATVAINGAKNAGLLAAQIIGVSNPAVRLKIELYKESLAAGVEKKDTRLAAIGIDAYLAEKGKG
jgi:5-(carboxyamino)imidazole ribonucleotide mutase